MLKIFFGSSRFLLCLIGLVLCNITSNAIIPTTISSGTYTVSTNDVCNGICTVMPNCTLKVVGNITAIFMNDIRVMDRASLIIDGATIKMAPGTRVFLNPYVNNGGTIPVNHRGAYMQTKSNAVITCSTSGQFWTGILVQGTNSSSLSPDHSLLEMENTRIEYALSAVNNHYVDVYGTGIAGKPTYNIASSGSITAVSVHFLNNIRSVNIYMSQVAFVSGNPTNPADVAENLTAQFINCTFDYTTGFTNATQEMMRLTDSRAIIIRSCTFTGKAAATPAQYTTVGIKAINSGFRVENHNSFNTPCKFTNLQTGIEVTNGLQVDRRALIRSAIFKCNYGINAAGTFNPLVLNCIFSDNNIPTWYGIYLRNSTGYRVEANDLEASTAAGPGIVVKNSGGTYNEIYRNKLTGRTLGVQSLGNNRTNNELTGLKVLCNKVETNADVTIMADPAIMINGMARYQYAIGNFNTILSAGNRYLNISIAGQPYHNYYIETGTNNIPNFNYRKNSQIPAEDPTYRNFPGVQNAANNTCPVHNAGAIATPYPFGLFAGNLSSLENQIATIEQMSNPAESDSIELGRLWVEHALLIDSAVMYYQDRDALDSIVMAYELVTKGYRNKLHLASAYALQGRYAEAISLLQLLSGRYTLTEEESKEVADMAVMYQCLQWLYQNDKDWENMPGDLRDAVFNTETEPMYAGAIARSLLAQYEDHSYEPDYKLPPKENEPMSKTITLQQGENMYPNPAQESIQVKWMGTNAVLTIKDVQGKTVLSNKLGYGVTHISLSKLSKGIYFASILQGGKTVYQQKVVKQ